MKNDIIKIINKDNSFIDYLKNYEKYKKCVVAITKNQLVFLPAISDFGDITHYELLKKLFLEMGDFDKNLICITVLYADIYMFLPTNMQVSKQQVALLYGLLDEIDLYNKNNGNKAVIHLGNLMCENNIDAIKECVVDYIKEDDDKRNENIIGKVADEYYLNEVDSHFTKLL